MFTRYLAKPMLPAGVLVFLFLFAFVQGVNLLYLFSTSDVANSSIRTIKLFSMV